MNVRGLGLGRFGAAFVSVSLALALWGCPGEDPQPGGDDFEVPSTISQEVNEGGPNPVAPNVVNVQNRGSCGLDYTATASTADGADWLTVSPSAGVVAAGAAGTLTVSIDVVATALLPGTYTGTITLAGTCETNATPARGSPKLIAVNLRVSPVGAAIAVDTTNIGIDLLPLANEWLDTAPRSSVATLATGARAVWTGREMWVVGGTTATSTAAGQGGRYDPVTNTWATLAPPAALRYDHTAVWTGTDMIAFGGRNQTLASMTSGARLGIGDALWTNLTTTGEPVARYGHTAVWTGTEMIVWGGADAAGTVLATGGRYDPSTDIWATTNAAVTGRANHSVVWTGTEMIVSGGTTVGGLSGGGGRYNPVTNTWVGLPTLLAPGAREKAAAVWTGKEFLVWGGAIGVVAVNTGGAYNPGDDAWSELETVGAPSARWNHAAVWTGGHMIVYGGEDAAGLKSDGAAYNPNTRIWTTLSAVNSPGAMARPAAVWTGASMLLADITTTDALLR